MKPIVTFGELLLRLSKTEHLTLTQGSNLTSHYGGSEANVAVSLATLGSPVAYVTRLPDSPLGHAAAMQLCQHGVDCKHVIFTDGRIGTYYLQPAAGIRPAKVIYDRADSAFAKLTPDIIPWNDILGGASTLSVSGIAAAISQTAADATFQAIDAADQQHLDIAFDINYRKNLWRYEGADPLHTLRRMLAKADIVFGDAIEFEFISQQAQPPFTATSSNFAMQIDQYTHWFEDMQRQAPRPRKWLMGMRNIVSSSHHTLTAVLWTNEQLLTTKIADIHGVVDPMGVGDAFMAAFLHALQVRPDDDQWALDYSLAAATLKNSITGDFNLATDEEIVQLMSTL